MQGVIDNAQEAHLAENVSLERAWELWNEGIFSYVTILSIAKHNDCECGGNRTGLICMNSDHMDLRIAMVKGLKGTLETLRVGDLYPSPTADEILASLHESPASEHESDGTGRVAGVADGAEGDTIG